MEALKIKTISQNCRSKKLQRQKLQKKIRPIENQVMKFNTPCLGTLQRKSQDNEKYRLKKMEMVSFS